MSETCKCVRSNCNGVMVRDEQFERGEIVKFFQCDVCHTTKKTVRAVGLDENKKWRAPNGMFFQHEKTGEKKNGTK